MHPLIVYYHFTMQNVICNISCGSILQKLNLDHVSGLEEILEEFNVKMPPKISLELRRISSI